MKLSRIWSKACTESSKVKATDDICLDLNDMKRLLLLTSLCSLLGLSGCSWLPNWWSNDKEFEPIISELKYKPYPFAVRQEIKAHQRIHIEYYGKDIPDELRVTTFDALLWADNKTLKLSVIAPKEKTLWNIQFNGETVHEERQVSFAQTVSSTQLLRDMAVAFWPQSNLRSQNKRFDVIDGDLIRQVINKASNEPEMTVVYRDGAHQNNPWGTVEIIHPLEQYRLIISSNKVR